MASGTALLKFASFVEQIVAHKSSEQLSEILATSLPDLIRLSNARIYLCNTEETDIHTVLLIHNGNIQLPPKQSSSIVTSESFQRFSERYQTPFIELSGNCSENPLSSAPDDSTIKSSMQVPLGIGSDLLGAISIDSADFNYRNEDLSLLKQVAALISAFIVRNNEQEKLNKVNNRQQAYTSKLVLLNNLAAELSLVNDLKYALNKVSKAGNHLVDADRLSYVELSTDRQAVVITGLVAASSDEVGSRVPLNDSGLEGTLLRAEIRYCRLGPECSNKSEVRLYESGYRHVWSLPVMSKGKVRAALNVVTKSACQYVEDSTSTLSTLANILGTTLERLDALAETEKKHRQMDMLARTDTLTGLANRYEFESLLSSKIGESGGGNAKFQVAYFDLDWFKNINDTLGHGIGDSVLLHVAKRLRVILREGDIAARIGGDEFLLLISTELDESGFDDYLEQILAELKRPLRLGEQVLNLSISLGVALFPEHGRSASELIKNSDIAMYDAKNAGRDRVSYFDQRLSTAINYKVRLEKDLREAIAAEQLTVVYQPKFDCQNNRICSMEALVRWEHPLEGPVGPDVFIPIAEESNLMNEITAFVLTTSLQDLKHFQAVHNELTLAVNISAVEFTAQSNLLERVSEALRYTHSSPSALEIEITETALIRNPGRAQELLESLSAQGTRIALDDFGTGYASLTYLAQLPIDTIKIDRSFVDGLLEDQGKQAIVDGVATMARRMGVDLVAEGVETKEQLEWLLATGCHIMQGYLISKPLCKEKMIDFLHESNALVDVA